MSQFFYKVGVLNRLVVCLSHLHVGCDSPVSLQRIVELVIWTKRLLLPKTNTVVEQVVFSWSLDNSDRDC